MMPRIRNDLKATPLEEQGIRYFDVSDPKSGARMRMYDFEWLIAKRMDGSIDFEDVATWAQAELGLQPTPDDIQEYADRLAQLGFFEMTLDQSGASEPKSSDFDDKTTAFDSSALLRSTAPLDTRATPPSTPIVTAPQKNFISGTGPTIAQPAIATPRPAPSPLGVATPASSPRTAPGPASTARPTSKVAPATSAKPPAKSGSGSLMALAIVALVVIGGGVVYLQVVVPNTAIPVTAKAATVHDQVQLFDGATQVKRSESQVLSFGEPGRITDVVVQGTEIKTGMPLATLDSFVLIEKTLADVNDRITFYDNEIAKIKAKNNKAATTALEQKREEKVAAREQLEARIPHVRLLSPSNGTVTQVLAVPGAAAKAGEPIVKIAGKQLSADFKLPAVDAAKLKPGISVSLANEPNSEDKKPLLGKVAKIDPATNVVSVEITDESVHEGQSLRLVKGRTPNVITLPSTAVVKRDGTDIVYVVTDGQAQGRKVTVSERTGAELNVTSGISAGDLVIMQGGETLHDGKKVVAQ